jgi:hypothetical protein
MRKDGVTHVVGVGSTLPPPVRLWPKQAGGVRMASRPQLRVTSTDGLGGMGCGHFIFMVFDWEVTLSVKHER